MNQFSTSVSFCKARFFLISDKMISPFFSPHYSNVKGPFNFAYIENNVMKSSLVFSIIPHTSARPYKYKHQSIKKDINDLMVKKISSGEFNTTLIPTDSKHTGSFTFTEIFILPLNTPNQNISFKTPDVRVGDQYEMIKSQALLEQNFGFNFETFKGMDGKIYFSKSNFFISYLKQHGIDYNPLELDLVVSPNAFMKILPEESCSFQDAINNNLVKSFTIKENFFNYENNNVFYMRNNFLKKEAGNINTEKGFKEYNHIENIALNNVLNNLQSVSTPLEKDTDDFEDTEDNSS